MQVSAARWPERLFRSLRRIQKPAVELHVLSVLVRTGSVGPGSRYRMAKQGRGSVAHDAGLASDPVGCASASSYLCRIPTARAGTGFEGDGLLRRRGRVGAVGRAGRVRAGAQPYCGPAPGTRVILCLPSLDLSDEAT